MGLTNEDLGLVDEELYDDSMDYAEDDYYGDDGSSGQHRDRRSSAARMRARRRARRRQLQQTRVRSTRLYRDPEHAKIGGVCAGLANYYGIETWVVRCLAVTGLLFMGQIVFPAYWIAYFVMDTPQKAQQRREPEGRRRRHRRMVPARREVPPGQTLRNVELDLNQAELRLRRIESHVTSGHYELQKELNRIDPESPVNGGNQKVEGAK
jgi:phage shock protein C